MNMDKIVLQITKNGKPVKQFKCPNKKFLAKHFLFVYNTAEKMKADEEDADIKVCVFTKQSEESAETETPVQAPAADTEKAPVAPPVKPVKGA